MNHEQVKAQAKELVKACKLLKMAINKREAVRNNQFYGVFISNGEQERKIQFMDAVVERIENRIKRIIKQLQE